MPHSPRRIRRRSAIVQQPRLYDGSLYKKSDAPRHRVHAPKGHTSEKMLSRSERSLISKSEPKSAPMSAASRHYRFHRIKAASSRRGKPYRNRKLAYCLAAAILIISALIASGLYIYYFVDGRNETKSDVVVFAPTLLPTKAPTTTWTESMNVSERIENVENGTWSSDTIEAKMKNETAEETLADVDLVKKLEFNASDEKNFANPEYAIDDAFYFSEKVCIEDEREKECVSGSGAELGTCSEGGSCTRVQYHANSEPSGEIFDPEAELRRLDLTSWPAPNGALCRRLSDHRLGVCVGGQCLALFNGTRRFNQIEGQWKDNCDLVNPCWTTPSTVPVENRSLCTSIRAGNDVQCANGAIVAVVWLEHRYCYMNPARSALYCKGLPLRLWLCRFCHGRNIPASRGLELARGYAMDACLQRYRAIPRSWVGGCVVSCDRLITNETLGAVVMPNGAVCRISDTDNRNGNSTGYCYNGRCFRAEASLYEEKLRTAEECEKQKRLDAEKWTSES